MKPGIALAASLIAACSLAFNAQAAPPEGKGPGNSAANPGKGNSGKVKSHPGNNGKGNPGKGNQGKGASGPVKSDKVKPGERGNYNKSNANRNANSHHRHDVDHRYDDRGRYYDYFDDRRDRRGHTRSGDVIGGLVYAGITAALARDYASEFNLRGYSSLPPGIRKNLARGKPLPPGIAKKVVPGSLLGRLPKHPGYEWRIAGSDLVLIAVATGIIADILYDVFD